MRALIFTVLMVFGVAVAVVNSTAAQTVTCRAEKASDATYRGKCIRGDSPISDIALHSPSSTAPHLWIGTANMVAGDALELGVDVRPGGTVRLGRSWLVATQVIATPRVLLFAYDPKVVAPPTSIDAAIILRARKLLADNAHWKRTDTTDMAAAPTKGFGCVRTTDLSMFCALYFASIDTAGDYAHFRPAINAVREAVASSTIRTYSHPIVDFNNESSRTLTDIYAALDFARAMIVDKVSLQTKATCDRGCLKKLTDEYLEALSRHAPRNLKLTSNVRFTENGVEQKIGEGFWKSSARAKTYRLYVLDPEGGAAAVQTVFDESGKDVLLLVRLKVIGKRISEIETLVVRERDSDLFAPEKLDSLERLDVPVLPSQRNSRKELLDITNGYFTALQTQGTKDHRPAAFADDANRYENGLKSTNVADAPEDWSVFRMSAREQFDKGIFRGRNVADRRYPVIDVENGTIFGIVTFRPTDPKRKLGIISEVFKIKGGKLLDIRAILLSVPGSTTGWD
jgi:hypothetical protein